MIYCRHCAAKREYPLSSVRTSRRPCDICGGYDPGFNLNYSYPDRLLPNTTVDENKVAEKEYDGAGAE